MDAHGGGVRVHPHPEAGGHQDLVVIGEGVDVLHVRRALDDGLQGLAHELHGIGGFQAGGGDHDVDHRHADLRLLLAGNGDQGEQADGDGRQQEQGRQG